MEQKKIVLNATKPVNGETVEIKITSEMPGEGSDGGLLEAVWRKTPSQQWVETSIQWSPDLEEEVLFVEGEGHPISSFRNSGEGDPDIYIEQLLQEASAYGLRGEIEEWAERFMKQGEGRREAYTNAYYEWIK